MTAQSGQPQPKREAYRSRIAALCAPRSQADPAAALERFRKWRGREPDTTLESAGWSLLVEHTPHTDVGLDDEGRIGVVLHGELLNREGRSASWVARDYARRGETVVPDLRGSFALLILDRATDSLRVVIDRKVSRRLYHSQDATGHYVSSDVLDQPTDRRDLDPVGVGWILAAGVQFDGRTVFEGIRALPRAQVHELGERGMASREYWSHALEPPAGPVNEDDLAAELKHLMIQAVERRADPDRDLFISLSGGMDSIGIVAVLGRSLGRRDVQTFSYVHGGARPGLDADVAARIAAALGMPHRTYESYAGDQLRFLRSAARLGQGTLFIPHEVDMFETLGPELESSNRPVLFTGEERMGFSSPLTEQSMLQLIGRSRIRALRPPASAARVLGRGLLKAIDAGIREDTQRVFARQPGNPDVPKIRLEMGFDHRICNSLIMWRERFLGAHATVRLPWLDADVMDFMRRVPIEMLEGKSLYKRVVAEMAPDVTAIGVAEAEGYRPDWQAEIRRNARDLERWIATSSSRLDDLVPPAFGLALLEAVRGTPSWNRRWDRLVRRVDGRLRRHRLLPEAWPVSGYHTVFANWAVLRMALGG